MRRLFSLAILASAVTWMAAGQIPPFIITTTTLPPGVLGQPYAPVILQTANDPGPVQWSVVVGAGNPPSGFVVGPSLAGQPITTGTFCFGAPTVGPPVCSQTGVQSNLGVYTFILQATSQSTGKTATQQYTMSVVQPLQITTTTLPTAQANQPYSAQIQVSGGSGSFLWSIVAGSLPPGISVVPDSGQLTGTAPNATNTYTFVVQVTDQQTQATAQRQLSISVLGGLGIITDTLPDAIVNQAYSFTLQASGGVPPLVWTVQTGAQLPPGFSLSTGGVLTGFGLAPGIFSFGIQVASPQAPGSPTATKAFTFYITNGALTIVEPTLPNATQNVAYRATLTGRGGIPPYRWSFDIANPQALSINATTGVITGTPPAAGAFSIPVTLKDATGRAFSQVFTLNVFAGVSITTTALANGTPGVGYLDTLAASGGALPYRWSVISGNLPTGLTLDSTTGRIQGTPTEQGPFQFTIQVTDFIGSTATKVLTITIGQGLVITTTSLPDGALGGVAYSQTLSATGGLAPLAWTIASGALPPGLTLDGASGVIGGTPTSAGNFTFDVLVTDAGKSTARKSFTIRIPLLITTGNLNGGLLSAFSQTLAATGGTPPYTWSLSGGTLPAGLQLNSSTGVISGTPTAPGASPVTFTVTDVSGLTGGKAITISILHPPAPTTSITLGSTTQPAVSLTLSAPYPLEITGFLTLTFASSVGGTDDMVRFSNGTRSLEYIVRANATQAIFPTSANPAILTGTVAGTITLTASLSAGGQNITPSPAPTRTIVIDSAVPVITSVALQQVTGGLSIVVSGYSNTREVSSGSFTFAVSSGNTLTQSQITVPLTSAYATWFNSAASNATGGQFKLTVPFSVTGSATAVTRVTVTLTNSKGTSAPASSP